MILLYLFVLPEQAQLRYDQDFSEPVFLLVLIALYARTASTASDANQRLFWRLMAMAFGSWLVVSIIGAVPAGRGIPHRELIEDCLYLIYFSILAVAIELRVDRNATYLGSQQYVTGALGSVLMVIAVFGYFAILPLLAMPEPYSPPYGLHGALDAYLAFRFLIAFTLTTNRSWKKLYAVLLAAFTAMVVSDLLSLAYQSGWLEYRAGSIRNVIWYAWYPIAMLAAGVRVESYGDDDSERGWQSRVATSALLGFGAVLPFLHVAGYALGWFSMETRFVRDVFIAVWIALVSALFYGLYFFIRDKVGAIDKERAVAERKADRFEDQLDRELRLRSLGRLSAGLAHDFGNSITAIAMYAGLIEKKSRRGEALDDEIRGLREGVGYAQDLVGKLKAFGSFGDRASTRPLDFNDEVRRTIEIIRPSLRDGVTLELNERASNLSVMAEAPMVHQVVTNFVYNAADAILDDGRIDVEVDCVDVTGQCASCGEPYDGRFVRLTVRDTGPGVPPALAGQIFEPLVSSKPVGKGSGLGLSTVHGVVHSLGGHVGFGITAGGGAEFSACFRPVDLDS